MATLTAGNFYVALVPTQYGSILNDTPVQLFLCTDAISSGASFLAMTEGPNGAHNQPDAQGAAWTQATEDSPPVGPFNPGDFCFDSAGRRFIVRSTWNGGVFLLLELADNYWSSASRNMPRFSFVRVQQVQKET